MWLVATGNKSRD